MLIVQPRIEGRKMQIRQRENGEGAVLLLPNGTEVEVIPWREGRALKIWVRGATFLIKPQGTNALELVLELEAAGRSEEDAAGSPSAAP
jgi:hypothetical protein